MSDEINCKLENADVDPRDVAQLKLITFKKEAGWTAYSIIAGNFPINGTYGDKNFAGALKELYQNKKILGFWRKESTVQGKSNTKGKKRVEDGHSNSKKKRKKAPEKDSTERNDPCETIGGLRKKLEAFPSDATVIYFPVAQKIPFRYFRYDYSSLDEEKNIVTIDLRE